MSTSAGPAPGFRDQIICVLLACLTAFAVVWVWLWGLDYLFVEVLDAESPLLFRIGVWSMTWWPIALPLAIVGCMVLLRSPLYNFATVSGRLSSGRCIAMGAGLAAFIGFAALGPFAMQRFPEDAGQNVLTAATFVATLYGYLCGQLLAVFVNKRLLNHAD